MAERLTDRTALSSPPAGDDLIHLVDVSDSTDNAAGTSKKQEVGDFLRGRTYGKNTTVTATAATTLIFNMSNTLNHPVTQALQDDWAVYMNEVEDRLVIGVAKQTCSSFPSDLDDTAKFLKFYDGNSLLP